MTQETTRVDNHTRIWKSRPRPPTKRVNDRHSLHQMVARICTIPPRLADHLLRSYSRPGESVLDPFCGRGTIPFEACRNGRVGIGVDISPEAVACARALLRAPTIEQVDREIVNLSIAADRIRESFDVDAIPLAISQLYHRETLKSILAWRIVLHRKRSDAAAFIRGCLLGILHGKGEDFLSVRCSHSYSMSPGYVSRYMKTHRLYPEYKSVAQCILRRSHSILRDGPPVNKGLAALCDARRLRLPPESVDLVLTSPPYFAVHRYARDNWLRLWFLGIEDYRQTQKQLIQTSDTAKYSSALTSALAECWRVLKPRRHALVLVGDVHRRRRANGGITRERVNTAALLAWCASTVGFSVDSVLTDTIPQKYKVAGYLGTFGGVATERLLILYKPSKTREA